MARDVRLLLGPPGTGKTETLLGEVNRLLDRGVAPERVAFVSFTNRAADEASQRAAEKFNLSPARFAWFRTIHSMAYRAVGLRRNEVMSTAHFKDLGEELGLEFTQQYGLDTERLAPGGGLGDRLMRAYSLARARKRAPEEEWDRSDEHELHRWSVIRFARQLEHYKDQHGLVDFCDMLDLACETPPLDLYALIVDEAQDLTAAQWAVVRHLGQRAHEVIIAGDDDQAIYEWAGADPSFLGRFRAKREVLPSSHRVPARVHELAEGISSRIRTRLPKAWRPRRDPGRVEWLPTWADDLDLSEGTWLLLARHRRQLARLVALCQREGVVYQVDGRWSYELPYVRAALAHEALRRGKELSRNDAHLVARYAPKARRVSGEATLKDVYPDGDPGDWLTALKRMALNEREYVRAALRRGESLNQPGRIRVSTIHSVKGAEADNVLLLTDHNRKVRKNLRTDAERRVWYVGVTRARERLVLAGPEAPILS